jgi:hypothetical protein
MKVAATIRMLLACLEELDVSNAGIDLDGDAIGWSQIDFRTDEAFDRAVTELRAPEPRVVIVDRTSQRRGATWRKTTVKIADVELTLAGPHRELPLAVEASQ